MAYDDETVKAKLTQLNETQDSIMGVSQWIMFHRRYANRTAQIWAKQLHNSFPPKRLSLIYLANDVIQQTKNKGKDDFYKAFSPIIVDAIGESYTGANGDTRGKLRRVLEIWRQRNIFEPDVQNAIERRVSDIDKGRGAKGKLGGSLFASSTSTEASVPAEMKELANLQTNLTKAVISSEATTRTATEEHDQLTVAGVPTPTPPVHAARLNQLLKSLSAANSSLQITLAARDALIASLEKAIAENRSQREKEQEQARRLESQRPDIEDRKAKVEDAIMKGLWAEPPANASSGPHGIDHANGADEDVPRPEVEQLTPPPAERLSPPPQAMPGDVSQSYFNNGSIGFTEDDGARTPADDVPPDIWSAQLGVAPTDSRTSQGAKRSADQTYGGNVENVVGLATEDPRRKGFENMTFKRRKTNDEQLNSEGLKGLDDDVVNMLG